MANALVIGGSGLVGQELVQLLQQDPYFSHVQLLSRRPLELASGKSTTTVVDFSSLDQLREEIQPATHVFCCIGTTQRKVKGDRKAYYAIDHDIPLRIASLAAEKGFTNFLLVSAVGASAASGNFYLKLKGETEDQLGKSGIGSISIFRPSILLGRRGESRPLETLSQWIMRGLGFLIVGSISRYRGITANQVARAMLNAAKKMAKGVSVYHYSEMVAGN
jgi:uncharacterized protein YbjT (DUF2867 family)